MIKIFFIEPTWVDEFFEHKAAKDVISKAKVCEIISFPFSVTELEFWYLKHGWISSLNLMLKKKFELQARFINYFCDRER